MYLVCTLLIWIRSVTWKIPTLARGYNCRTKLARKMFYSSESKCHLCWELTRSGPIPKSQMSKFPGSGLKKPFWTLSFAVFPGKNRQCFPPKSQFSKRIFAPPPQQIFKIMLSPKAKLPFSGRPRFGYGLGVERFEPFRVFGSGDSSGKFLFSLFQCSLTGRDGSSSGFGFWKTVPVVPVPLSVSGSPKNLFGLYLTSRGWK